MGIHSENIMGKRKRTRERKNDENAVRKYFGCSPNCHMMDTKVCISINFFNYPASGSQNNGINNENSEIVIIMYDYTCQ
jgi:hypothetical protein